MLSDGELLQRYVDDASEAAFTELVRRHINVVYGSALRRVGRDAHSADDVTQRVFTDLARKAQSLQGRPNLGGWLYTSTRFAAAATVRAEQRRRVHEQEAHLMNELTSPDSDLRGRMELILDEVVDRLDERDREAVLLHFFEERSFVEVGAILSLSADAARMRVNRAVERLRVGFEQRGIASTGAALAVMLASQTSVAAPASLAPAVASRALLDAGALTGGSAAGGVAQAGKLSPIFFSTGVAVVVALAAVAFRAMDPGGQRNESSFAAGGAPTAPAGTSSVAADVATSAPAEGAAINQRMVAAPAPAPDAFDALTAEEKNLLAMLWAQHERNPSLPAGVRMGLKVGDAAPNASGVDRLVAKGWVEITARKGAVSLTQAGVIFCETQRAGIEAYTPSANLRPPRS